MESDLTPIGQTSGVMKYRTSQSVSMPNGERQRLLNRPPLIKPQEHPTETMRRIFQIGNLDESEDYKLIKNHLYLVGRQGNHGRWDEYRTKIPQELLDTWVRVMTECRRNGFINPHVEHGVIVFDQVLASGMDNADLCTLCDRYCIRREMVDTGELKRRKTMNKDYQELEMCWVQRGFAR